MPGHIPHFCIGFIKVLHLCTITGTMRFFGRNPMQISSWLGSLLISTLAYSAAANANTPVIQLDFTGVGNRAAVQTFYNGGSDSLGNTGANYGVSFSDSALSLSDIDPDANFAAEPSPHNIMFFLSGSAYLNIAEGFTQGFSFYYSTIDFTGQVDIYDGLNATGTRLGSLTLDALGEGPVIDRPYSNWKIAALSFNGMAKSVNFSGTVNEVGFDNITLGSLDPSIPAVPEASSTAQLLLGLGVIALLRRRYRKTISVRA